MVLRVNGCLLINTYTHTKRDALVMATREPLLCETKDIETEVN